MSSIIVINFVFLLFYDMTAISNQSLLILALVLIVIGAILLYSPIPYPAGTIGNILIVIGIIVLVIWIVLMVVRAIRHV